MERGVSLSARRSAPMKDSLGEVISVDGKSLRGSQRELPALGVVVAVGQEIRVALGQEEIKGENAIEAALRLIQGLLLEGRVVTLDAGLNQREIAHAIVEKGRPYLGVVKENHAHLREALLLPGVAHHHRTSRRGAGDMDGSRFESIGG